MFRSNKKPHVRDQNARGSLKRSSAYDRNFEQDLADHGIYMNSRKSKASNIAEISRRLAEPRRSLSPSLFSEQDFERFQQKSEEVIDENEVMRDVLPMLYGPADILHKENLLFTRLESITDNKTVVAKPDSYDGAALDSIDMQVQVDLGPLSYTNTFPEGPSSPKPLH